MILGFFSLGFAGKACGLVAPQRGIRGTVGLAEDSKSNELVAEM